MIRHSAQTINKARELALKEHLSYKEIGRRLGVSDSTISIWFRNVKDGNPRKYVQTNRSLRETIKKSEISIFNKIKIDVNLAKIYCGILYGCEGSKYPASNCIIFTNSEPKLILAFVNLLRNAYELDESKFRIILQVHSNQNYIVLSNYWSKILKIPIDKFYKPTITIANEGKHKDNYLGTCTIKYYDYKLQLKLIGIYEQFMRKSSLMEGIPIGSGDSSLNCIA